MKVLNFGSLNIDHVYEVDHFVRPGETLAGNAYHRFCGGKGCNQSLALARAGAKTFHAGRIGSDGLFLKDTLAMSGADTSLLEMDGGPSGHAIIQVSKEGENSIILFGGANRNISSEQIKNAVSKFKKGDFILLQNEINSMPEIISAAAKARLRIFFNPAPMGKEVEAYPLDLVDCLILNEVEGAGLAGGGSNPEDVLKRLEKRFPKAAILLTLGSKGAVYSDNDGVIKIPAEKVKAVDTTAAGDTFIGYFLAGLAAGDMPEKSLKTASKAAAICVTRKGAADSIPWRKEIKG